MCFNFVVLHRCTASSIQIILTTVISNWVDIYAHPQFVKMLCAKTFQYFQKNKAYGLTS